MTDVPTDERGHDSFFFLLLFFIFFFFVVFFHLLVLGVSADSSSAAGTGGEIGGAPTSSADAYGGGRPFSAPSLPDGLTAYLSKVRKGRRG